MTLYHCMSRTPLAEACDGRRRAVQQWLLRVGGGGLLDNDRVRQHLHPDDRAALVTWLRHELAPHDTFVPLVLWGMMRRRSGTKHLWRLGGKDGMAGVRMLVAGFVGVPVGRTLGHLRSSLAVLAAMW